MLIYLSFIFTLSSGCAISKTELSRKNEEIKVATWNIGHFSEGKKYYSTIQPSEYKHKLASFRSLFYDSISADVLCINEYEEIFCKDSTGESIMTEEAILDGFRVSREVTKSNYVCNAIFSNKKLKHVKKCDFMYNMTAKKDMPRIIWHYYMIADITVAGEKVKLINTHLVNRNYKHCQNQIKELISICIKDERVIICGDFNTTDFSQFKKSGYLLANDGSMVTFPGKSYVLDNVIVKGLKISDVRVIKSSLSDHYPLVCRISL